ncbi:MAG: GNAT family N-acetyltransferase [Burkholderiaceae bacterium]|jgi:GNAT superfamily N-acetyltransferase|nr:GNAT family N-acetyltransferase [Burkholderiaceae bacterium]
MTAGDGLSVRAAVPEDVPALRALFLRARRDSFAWQDGRAWQLEDFDAQTRGERLWVAVHGLRVVGFIALWEPDDFIHHLYIDRPWRRRGVGGRLLKGLPGWSATRFRLKCLCRNAAALAFYRAGGFAEVGSGGEGDEAYLLLESAP